MQQRGRAREDGSVVVVACTDPRVCPEEFLGMETERRLLLLHFRRPPLIFPFHFCFSFFDIFLSATYDLVVGGDWFLLFGFPFVRRGLFIF